MAIKPATIEKVGEGRFDIEKINIDVPDDEKASFLSNPTDCITKALEAGGRKVNQVAVNPEALEAIVKQVETGIGFHQIVAHITEGQFTSATLILN